MHAKGLRARGDLTSLAAKTDDAQGFLAQLETELAREMLSGRIEDGDKVRVAWSTDDQKITFEKLASAGDKAEAAEADTDDAPKAASEAAEDNAAAPAK